MENVFVAVLLRERMSSVQRSGAQRSKNDGYAQSTWTYVAEAQQEPTRVRRAQVWNASKIPLVYVSLTKISWLYNYCN